MWHPAHPKWNGFYSKSQEFLEFLSQHPLVKKPILIVETYDSYFAKNRDSDRVDFMWSMTSPKCTFIRFTSDWEKTTLLGTTCSLKCGRVKRGSETLPSLYIGYFLKKNIPFTITGKFLLPGLVHSFLIGWVGFSNFIRLRVNNLNGNKKAELLRRRISF